MSPRSKRKVDLTEATPGSAGRTPSAESSGSSLNEQREVRSEAYRFRGMGARYEGSISKSELLSKLTLDREAGFWSSQEVTDESGKKVKEWTFTPVHGIYKTTDARFILVRAAAAELNLQAPWTEDFQDRTPRQAPKTRFPLTSRTRIIPFAGGNRVLDGYAVTPTGYRHPVLMELDASGSLEFRRTRAIRGGSSRAWARGERQPLTLKQVAQKAKAVRLEALSNPGLNPLRAEAA